MNRNDIWLRLGVALALAVVGSTATLAQNSTASWIAPAGTGPDSVGVYDFQKTVSLRTVPQGLPVEVSADNRFILYVNGQRIGDGPARGDLAHWRYEKLDIAKALHPGSNIIAARVWSFGALEPTAQISLRPGFLLRTDASTAKGLQTDATWLVREEHAWSLEDTAPGVKWHVGPNETIDGAKYDWLWNTTATQSGQQGWAVAEVLPATEAGVAAAAGWHLIADELPPMEHSPASAGDIVRSSIPSQGRFPQQAHTVSANSHISLLLDRKTMTTAYPELTVSGGKGARITLTYTEALYDKDGKKGNRSDIAGKTVNLALLHDRFLPDGGAHRIFAPLWWRSWRYLQIDVDTSSEPLKLESLKAFYTAYPFQERATFASNDPVLERIMTVGWRTLRNDAHETYMDSPYWEQMQYIGDTRIEALVSYVMSGDDRLAQQAMRAFGDSVVADGLTQSRYPSNKVQVIPPFSLFWIGMLHDAWWYRPDHGLVTQSLPVVRSSLAAFTAVQRPDGLLKRLEDTGYLKAWYFLDWEDSFKRGIPPQDADGGSIPLSLQFAQGLRDAADLEDVYGDKLKAAADREQAEKIVQAAYAEGWDAKRGLLADTPAKLTFSQQTNILGVMTDAIPAADQKHVMQTLLQDELDGKPIYAAEKSQLDSTRGTGPAHLPADGIASATYYFRFYLARALDHAGMADLYLKLLGPWRGMLQLGLSTWAEKPEETRSDAHAWSSHPNYDLLTLVAGIRPASAGFQTVTIAPHLGELTALRAAMPVPAGTVTVDYHVTRSGLKAEVRLPASMTGTFTWHGSIVALHAGTQTIQLPTPGHGAAH